MQKKKDGQVRNETNIPWNEGGARSAPKWERKGAATGNAPRSYRKRLSLQICYGDDLDILDRIENIFRIWRQFGDALFEVEHFFSEFDGF